MSPRRTLFKALVAVVIGAGWGVGFSGRVRVWPILAATCLTLIRRLTRQMVPGMYVVHASRKPVLAGL